MYRAWGKRAFDLALTLPALVLLAPVFTLVALAIWLEDRGPPLFRQVRCGLNGAPFRIHKFRTMKADDGKGSQITISGDTRITRVGAWLRRYKIDELPQLIDVARGHMSLVGPRPEVARYMDAYARAEREEILSVRPGITDYAAILFRNESELLAGEADVDTVYVQEIMPIKLRYYRAYIATASLWVDLRIITATIRAILGLDPSRCLPDACHHGRDSG